MAVRQQYLSVLRLKKEARHEGKRGVSYVDLVSRALTALPNRCGMHAGAAGAAVPALHEVQGVLTSTLQHSLLPLVGAAPCLRSKQS